MLVCSESRVTIQSFLAFQALVVTLPVALCGTPRGWQEKQLSRRVVQAVSASRDHWFLISRVESYRQDLLEQHQIRVHVFGSGCSRIRTIVSKCHF